jgi:hypothetical protein
VAATEEIINRQLEQDADHQHPRSPLKEKGYPPLDGVFPQNSVPLPAWLAD